MTPASLDARAPGFAAFPKFPTDKACSECGASLIEVDAGGIERYAVCMACRDKKLLEHNACWRCKRQHRLRHVWRPIESRVPGFPAHHIEPRIDYLVFAFEECGIQSHTEPVALYYSYLHNAKANVDAACKAHNDALEAEATENRNDLPWWRPDFKTAYPDLAEVHDTIKEAATAKTQELWQSVGRATRDSRILLAGEVDGLRAAAALVRTMMEGK